MQSDLTMTGNFGQAAFNRRWRVKVQFHECGQVATPPPDCFQYVTGVSGQIRSFNFVRTDGEVRLSLRFGLAPGSLRPRRDHDLFFVISFFFRAVRVPGSAERIRVVTITRIRIRG